MRLLRAHRPSADALGDADVVLKVQRPLTSGEGGPDETLADKLGALLIGILAPYAAREQLADYVGRNVTAFAMELVPRITRAQTMDVLVVQPIFLAIVPSSRRRRCSGAASR